MTDTDKHLPISELIELAEGGIVLVTSEIAKNLEHDDLMDIIALSSATSLLAIAKLLNYRFIGGIHD